MECAQAAGREIIILFFFFSHGPWAMAYDVAQKYGLSRSHGGLCPAGAVPITKRYWVRVNGDRPSSSSSVYSIRPYLGAFSFGELMFLRVRAFLTSSVFCL
jgi:hypothetical protein